MEKLNRKNAVLVFVEGFNNQKSDPIKSTATKSEYFELTTIR